MVTSRSQTRNRIKFCFYLQISAGRSQFLSNFRLYHYFTQIPFILSRMQRDLPKQSMKISYLKQKFKDGRSGKLVLLIQLPKRQNFVHLKKRENKALRGCRRYVSWNVNLSVILCRDKTEIKKEIKTKTKNRIKQNNNNNSRTIVRLFQGIGRKVAKYNPS